MLWEEVEEWYEKSRKGNTITKEPSLSEVQISLLELKNLEEILGKSKLDLIQFLQETWKFTYHNKLLKNTNIKISTRALLELIK